jgi:hypothetical protein
MDRTSKARLKSLNEILVDTTSPKAAAGSTVVAANRATVTALVQRRTPVMAFLLTAWAEASLCDAAMQPTMCGWEVEMSPLWSE